MSQSDGLGRMPDFSRWLFALLTKCSRSIINVNDLALHLCSYREDSYFSNWQKEGTLSPLPTNTKSVASEAAGEVQGIQVQSVN